MIQSPVGHESSEIRVILVGQTGLDAALRRDPAIELIRSRTPLDAIGELADPIDDTSPTRSVVIVAPDAEPDAARTRQFIDGLRLVDPHVRVLCVKNGKPGHSGLYDAQVEASGVGNAEPSEALLAAIRGEAVPRTKAKPPATLDASMPPASVPSSASSPQPPALRIVGGEAEEAGTFGSSDAAGEEFENAKDATVAGRVGEGVAAAPADADRLLERKPSLTGVGDEHLAAEIIRGRDPRELALQVLRARLGDRRIELLDVATAEPAAPDAARVPVRWGEHDLGLLEADGVSARDLQRHADWLAAWLRLDQQHRDLRDAAYRDPLTGAWNRRYFDRFFDAALAKSRDGRHNLTLLVFDIDDFKVYNDRYGHGAGDEILIETVRLLQSVVRPTDRVCRIGGDEFAVVFYEPTGPRAAGSRHPTSFFAISKRFQQQIWDHRFPKLGPQAPGTLTISGGLATYPWDGVTTQQLLERADRLALDSKRLGKNAITLGPGAMRACNGGE